MADDDDANSGFDEFLDAWIVRQESLLRRMEKLVSPVDGFDQYRECREMIPMVLSHYQELYREKARVAAEDVFAALSPSWMSAFERSLLWISEFRPSMLFPVVEGALAGELSAEQGRRIATAKVETRRREREIEQAMAQVQETVAAPAVCVPARRFGKMGDGEAAVLEPAMGEVSAEMLAVVERADNLRGWAAAEVLGALDPVQGVKVLAAAARFQVWARSWGRRRDKERRQRDSPR